MLFYFVSDATMILFVLIEWEPYLLICDIVNVIACRHSTNVIAINMDNSCRCISAVRESVVFCVAIADC